MSIVIYKVPFFLDVTLSCTLKQGADHSPFICQDALDLFTTLLVWCFLSS